MRLLMLPRCLMWWVFADFMHSSGVNLSHELGIDVVPIVVLMLIFIVFHLIVMRNVRVGRLMRLIM